MASKKPVGTHVGDFQIEYKPEEKRQQVGIVFKNYKNEGQDKVFAMFKSQFNSLMDCDPASGFGIRRPLDEPCTKRNGCEIIGEGKFSVGGITDSNPVTLTFDDGKMIKLSMAKIAANPQTCSKGLDDLKV